LPGTSDIVIDMVEGDEAAPIRSIAMKEKHFKNPPMFTFTSDSPNIAMKLHRLAGESNEFLLVMGCTPHALHKYTEDLIKEFPGPKRILKQLVSMVIGVRKVHLILALFDNLCVQKYGRTLVLFLYTKSRQGTVYWSAQRALRVRTALMVLPGEIAAKDLTIAIPNGLMNLLLDGAFWKGVAALEMVFKPIVSCLTSLEGDFLVRLCLLLGHPVSHTLSEGQREVWFPRQLPERCYHREHEEPSTPPLQHHVLPSACVSVPDRFVLRCNARAEYRDVRRRRRRVRPRDHSPAVQECPLSHRWE
jgi:hypothetical protein